MSLRLGVHVAALDALGQRHLLLGGEQRHLADLAQVHAHRVVGGRLDREVELGDDLVVGLGIGGGAGRDAFALEDVDAVVGEDVVDVVDLVERELDVLQRIGDVLARQVALLETLIDEQPRPRRWTSRRARSFCCGLLRNRSSASSPSLGRAPRPPGSCGSPRAARGAPPAAVSVRHRASRFRRSWP